MLLYINGDSHSAGAEAVNSHCFAEDDSQYFHLGRGPHPDNLKASYGYHLSQSLQADLVCEAESASSNTRIIRTTKEFLVNNKPDLVVIGWATWEREEWLHNKVYYQLTASGTDRVPKELATKYKEWVVETANQYADNELANHSIIWDFHCYLQSLGIPHFFFNTYSCFSHIRINNLPKLNWNDCYLDPYSDEFTYFNWAKANGCQTVNPESYHYGPDAHEKWAEFLLPRLTTLI